ncbi:Ctr copper transporter [Fomes fomentarius]|nr:Ctr copper transporter [Fomes fomentarius]
MTSSMNGMMVPWLHFPGGDNLFFESWTPSSPGAIAGACIGLALLAIAERWVNGTRGVLDVRWKRALSSAPFSHPSEVACHTTSSTLPLSQGTSFDGAKASQSSVRSDSERVPRTLPPFIASHDIVRGALFAFQSLLLYILMLALMTFQAAFLISIIGGLLIGEVLFGRVGGKGHIGH